eukprot:SAG11_NODE_300_length_11057_cov_5.223469_4_plen_279_part_00
MHPHQLWHFLAYARGAHQIFVDTPVPTANPPAPSAHPPAPAPPPPPKNRDDPPAPPGWRLYRGYCMNDEACRPAKHSGWSGCPCADGSLVGEVKCAGGSSRAQCVRTAMAACKATKNCTALSLLGGSYQLWPYNNWSAVPNTGWDSYAMVGPKPPSPGPTRLKTDDDGPRGHRRRRDTKHEALQTHARQSTHSLRLETEHGVVEIALLQSAAPETVQLVKKLAEAGLYSGCVFYRAEPGFVVQGGLTEPSGATRANPFGAVPLEFKLANLRGTVTMAR